MRLVAEDINTFSSGADVIAHAHATRQRLHSGIVPEHARRRAPKPPMREFRGSIAGPPAPLAEPPADPLRCMLMPTLNPVDTIIKAACNYLLVTRADIMSARRTARPVYARHIAMFVARSMTLKSLPEIGRRMGNRDHTTVIHGALKISAAIAAGDLQVTADVNSVRRLAIGIDPSLDIEDRLPAGAVVEIPLGG